MRRFGPHRRTSARFRAPLAGLALLATVFGYGGYGGMMRSEAVAQPEFAAEGAVQEAAGDAAATGRAAAEAAASTGGAASGPEVSRDLALRTFDFASAIGTLIRI